MQAVSDLSKTFTKEFKRALEPLEYFGHLYRDAGTECKPVIAVSKGETAVIVGNAESKDRAVIYIDSGSIETCGPVKLSAGELKYLAHACEVYQKYGAFKDAKE